MKRLFVVAAIATLAMLGATPAFAHGHRAVGEVEFTVGWAVEPAIAGQPNAVQLIVERDGAPVEGAEETLQVDVTLGDESTGKLPLRTVFDAPGEYRADLIPTATGGYTFHFTGKVGDEDVDQSFTSPKDGFDEVEGTSDIAFPDQAPTSSELAQRLATAEKAADDANSAAGLGRILAIVAIALAVVAFIAGRRKSA